MRLVTFGCSHTHGQGILPEDRFYRVEGSNEINFSKKSWAAQLADMLGAELLNLSRPGSANNEITKKILSYKPREGDIVAVAWTYFTRHTVFREHLNDVNCDVLPTYENHRFFKDYKLKQAYYELHDDYNLALKDTMLVDHGYRILNSLGVPFVCNFVNYRFILDKKTFDIENSINQACYTGRQGLNLDPQMFRDFQKEDFKTVADTFDISDRLGADGDHYSPAVHQKIAEAYFSEIRKLT
jgi:hypothetical protein